MKRTAALLASVWMLTLAPEAQAADASVGGYLRLGIRPDFQGGDNKLGYWNLYGRLLNESPYFAVEGRVELLEREPGSIEPWTLVHARVEGGAVPHAGPANGSLADLRLSQLYIQAGNVLGRGVVWQIGTLDTWMGDLGLYDFRPTTLFDDALGVSAQVRSGPVDVMVAFGDAGYSIRNGGYNSVLTAGGNIRVAPIKGLEFGLGGQVWVEPGSQGNINAPYITPGVDYEDWVRGEVAETWVRDNPGLAEDFPTPEATTALSWKLVGYAGFGGFGPLKWNATHFSYQRLHPEGPTTEFFNDEEYTIYTTALTDERDVLTIGNEMQLEVAPGRFDVVWGALYGSHQDRDNDVAVSDHDRWYWSTVLRGQVYATPLVHFLFESSYAQEYSRNGNAFRARADSIFRSAGGLSDGQGLEYGDMDQRDTFQGKGGLVLNPLGPGVFVRPSLRFLYGIQWSSQNNAFGNNFVETLDEYNDFGAVERHWHHVLAVEAEVWF